MDKYIIINTTCENKEQADMIAGILLEKKLVSCIQMNEIESHYKWKDKIEIDKEILLKLKTKASLFKKIEQIIKENHSYEIPQIIALPIIDGLKEYLNWIDEVTEGEEN